MAHKGSIWCSGEDASAGNLEFSFFPSSDETLCESLNSMS